jgi:hypothetical protein
LEHAAGFERDDNAERRLDKLEAILAPSTKDMKHATALLADLLSIAGDRYPALHLNPQRRKEKTLEALLAQLAGLAAERPVLMVFEDVHWIDPISLELLELTVKRVPSLPVLLVITFRSEFPPPWTGDAHVTTLALNRLGRRNGAELVNRLTGNKELPSAIVDQITAHADGVPLFVEELTKTVLESGLLRDRGDRYVLTGPVAPLAIPTTLHASLMARLDRLAPILEVAQIVVSRPGPPTEKHLANGRGAPCPFRVGLLPRHAAERDLHVQACPDPGCGVRDVAAEPTSGAACADCESAGRSVSGDGGVASRDPHPPLVASGPGRESGALCIKDLAAHRRLSATEGAPWRLQNWGHFVQAGQPISL